MAKRTLLKKGVYFDSVTLMQITGDVKKSAGVTSVVVGMGTDFNIDSLKRLDLFCNELTVATPSDLIIAVAAESDASADAAVALAEKLLVTRRVLKSGGDELVPATLASAMKAVPDSNVVVISLPGRFAAAEAHRALDAGKHVMLFSDNVTVEEELSLKEKAVAKGLLMMGPDCGTAILNGVPLAFANAVRKGNIGVVAASGTGLQEVTSLIHRFGAGITQAIGVGGRDLSEKIGGRMTLMAARALALDPETKVLLLVSKPPAASTQEKLFSLLKGFGKPVVVYFIGANPADIEKAGFVPAGNLEEAARRAVKLATGKDVLPLVDDAAIAKAAAGVKLSAPNLRGLYSGGTLCDETQRILAPLLPEVHSNTPIAGVKGLKDIHVSEGHTIVDLGDDDFTRGKAHPMIDPTARCERLLREFADPSAGLILLDVVLGYGSHMDMAGELVAAIEKARRETKRNPAVAATICGTDEDPQGYASQKAKLEAAGVTVFPSNVSLARFAAQVLQKGAAR